MEYRSTTGRPCGQLIGQSVFASASSSHSIFDCSSGVFTLMAAWHAVDAAIFACNVSMEIAAFSRSMPSRISRSSFSASGRSEEHTSELQSRQYLVCRLLLEKKKKIYE